MTLALSGGASAVGLGELRGQATLGEGLRLEVPLLGAEKLRLDPACFRLTQPSSVDIPWLKRADLAMRPGSPAVLQIRSEVPLREPVMQVALTLGCGHEVSREYIVMASPARESEAAFAARPEVPLVGESPAPALPRRPARPRSAAPATSESAAVPAPPARRQTRVAPLMPDRLSVSAGGEVGEPSLRLALDLLSDQRPVVEAQREVLRLEYRMLMAMHEQATTQLAAAEKLRDMEGTLGGLQQRAADLAQRMEKDAKPAVVSPPGAAVEKPAVAHGVAAPKPAPVHVPEDGEGSSWGLYGALLGAVLGLAGWLGWRRRQQSAQVLPEEPDVSFPIPDVVVDPQRASESEEPGGVDLPFEPAAMGMPMQVDVDLDTGSHEPAAEPPRPESPLPVHQDSVLSINATSLDEHFEANPVMELADIMLSFGRVKGAAQALQEYIDNNPQEALQPWIRLMDVYRLAGMRGEFEAVARNLNQNFNVEVQSWDAPQVSSADSAQEGQPEAPVAPRPESLEDMPRLMRAVIDQWPDGDVVGYLYQLLRDNRGGQRLGFALPVVEDILFLIELKETANRMEGAE